MVFDVGVAMTWLLFIALFPITFFWLRRAWRILIKKNYSEVATKKGLSPANPQKWALIVGLINLGCGGMTAWIIIALLFAPVLASVMTPYSYDTWSAMAGLTIWGKIIADFIIRFQAHPMTFGKNKATALD